MIRVHACVRAPASCQHKPKGRAPPAGQPPTATARVRATMCHRRWQTTARGLYGACEGFNSGPFNLKKLCQQSVSQKIAVKSHFSKKRNINDADFVETLLLLDFNEY